MRYNVPTGTYGGYTRSSYQKLNIPRWKTNVERKALTYIGPSIWNNFSKTLKSSTSLHDFKWIYQ